jgi:glyoxylase-like metal-dependent hydrolase (beta-lactamase superfamily II)
MVAEVKILVEGYTNADSVDRAGEEKTCATITLVRDDGTIMVVDPGVLESQQILIDELAKENLTVKDVNFVCITHSHIDHYRNIGMFPNAKALDFSGVWDKNVCKDWQENFTTNIQIMKTPGHDYTSITLFVDTDEGVVAICGDVFWKENYPAEPQGDAYALDHEKLKQSRKMVLEMADWIIPGHAGIYKTNRIYAQKNEKVATKKMKEQKIIIKCKKCGKPMERGDRCLCRAWLCHKCCECGMDCDSCGCSHKK